MATKPQQLQLPRVTGPDNAGQGGDFRLTVQLLGEGIIASVMTAFQFHALGELEELQAVKQQEIDHAREQHSECQGSFGTCKPSC